MLGFDAKEDTFIIDFQKTKKLPFLAYKYQGEIILFENIGANNYKRINTIGGRGISEYKKGEKNAVNLDV